MKATSQVLHFEFQTAGGAHTAQALAAAHLMAVKVLKYALALRAAPAAGCGSLLPYMQSASCVQRHTRRHTVRATVQGAVSLLGCSTQATAQPTCHTCETWLPPELLCNCSVLARAGGRSSLLRVYVAELPPKYNLHTIAKDGCKESNVLATLLGSPLGTLLSASLDDALYRYRNSKRPR